MENIYRLVKILLFFCIAVGLHSCTGQEQIFIVTGDTISTTENLTVNHLKKDLETVSGKTVFIIQANKTIPKKGILFIVGTPSSNQIIGQLIKSKDLILTEKFPGNRGGIWAKVKLEDGLESIVLAGSDVQGMQYAVFDYSQKVLGTDPFEYWTGKLPDSNKPFTPFNFVNKIIAPPEIPVLCYFENDVDELANLKTPLLEYDWESYTEMINSLVRLKYNAIHLFDMLGRPEFFQREPYQKIRPGYDVRLSYIDSLLNYAHDMGMMVAIDLSLGYKIKPMAQRKADCWEKNKSEWIATWKYYFEETPIAKADIFSLRPRNQVWDWEYKSSCSEDKIEVFNEVYDELGKLIDQYNPDAIKVATCYADAMEMFNQNFNPPKDWIIAWSDDGWGGFSILPESTKGYEFGTYMHAGFWKNHTVHDPYPEKIDSTMKMMCDSFQANKYWEINGQQFRPFLLNIEAFADLACNPNVFDYEAFYNKWTNRYFGEKAAVFAVNSMKKLHEAQFDNVGYVEHLWEVKIAISYLSKTSAEQSDMSFDYTRLSNNFELVDKRIQIINQSLSFALQGLEFVGSDDTFYNDYIVLPAQLYLDLLTFESRLYKMAALKKVFEDSGNRESLEEAISLLAEARKDLHTIYQRSLEGDKNKKWAGWYNPAKRRPNNGFPTTEMLDIIESNLKNTL